MNILILASVKWYNASAHYALTIAKGLQNKGYNVYLGGIKNSLILKKALEKEIKIVELSKYNYTYNIIKLYNFIKNNNISLVNMHRGEDHFTISLLKLLTKLNFKTVYTRGDIRKPKINIANILLHNKNLLNGVILVSDFMKKDYYSKLFEYPSSIEVIKLGIDTNEFPIFKKNIKKNRNNLVILGRLDEIKGHKTIINALRFLPDDVILNIVGPRWNLDINILYKFSEEIGVRNRIIYHDFIENLYDFLKTMDIAVIASKGSEAICRVALEFMALGLPIVASSINGLADIIENGINGFLIKPADDSKAFAEKIIELLNNDDLYKFISENNNNSAKEKYSLEIMTDKTINFFENLS